MTSTSGPAAPSGIGRRLLVTNELSGFGPNTVTVYPTIRKWMSGPGSEQPPDLVAAEKAMLTREGFRIAATETIESGDGVNNGVSIVEQFRSVKAARAALAYYGAPKDRAPAEGKYAPFKVSGIPGAVGFSLGDAAGGINIAFTRGAYYYLVARTGRSRLDIAELDAAARHLYGRERD